MDSEQATFKRLVDAGWDDDTAREAAAIEHGGHGCISEPNDGEGDDKPRPRRRIRRRNPA